MGQRLMDTEVSLALESDRPEYPLTLPHTSFTALAKLLPSSVPQFPHCKMWMN